MNAIRLENWSVCNNGPWTPPECRTTYLQGIPSKWLVRSNHRGIRTSAIKEVNKRVVTTASGSVYQLGRIDPKYRRWLKKNKIPFNWRDPIVKRKGQRRPPQNEVVKSNQSL